MPTKPRPDFSDYVAHFTKSGKPCGDDNDGVIIGNALVRLLSILEMKTIKASFMPWTNRKAVAFTECPWGSLISHTKQYSPYGLGFSKEKLFAFDGGPAIYLRGDLHEKQHPFQHSENPKLAGFHPDVYAFVTPFNPPYASPTYKNKYWKGKKPVDYTHEREWRVPHDFKFEYEDIQFVVLPDYDAMAKFPKSFKDSIGRNKFILAEVYSTIEQLWPVHIL